MLLPSYTEEVYTPTETAVVALSMENELADTCSAKNTSLLGFLGFSNNTELREIPPDLRHEIILRKGHLAYLSLQPLRLVISNQL